MAKYIRNPGGQIHSLSDEAYEAMLEGDGETSERYLPHGYAEVREADAKKAHPQLFGEADPAVEAARVGLGAPAAGDFEAKVNAAVEAKVAEAVAAALAAQGQ